MAKVVKQSVVFNMSLLCRSYLTPRNDGEVGFQQIATASFLSFAMTFHRSANANGVQRNEAIYSL